VVDLDKADCIVYVRIVSYSVSDSGNSSYDEGRGVYLPSLWSISMQAEFSVSVPGRATPLLSNRSVGGSAKFQENIDQYMSQEYGTQQACRAIAVNIVTATTEAW